MVPGLHIIHITCSTHLSTLIKFAHVKKPFSRTEPGWHDHSRSMGGKHLERSWRRSVFINRMSKPAPVGEQTRPYILTSNPTKTPPAILSTEKCKCLKFRMCLAQQMNPLAVSYSITFSSILTCNMQSTTHFISNPGKYTRNGTSINDDVDIEVNELRRILKVKVLKLNPTIVVRWFSILYSL